MDRLKKKEMILALKNQGSTFESHLPSRLEMKYVGVWSKIKRRSKLLRSLI